MANALEAQETGERSVVTPAVEKSTLPTEAAEARPPATDRVLSLDALRGFNMFWIIGGAEVVDAIAKKIDNPIVRRISDNLTSHVNWEGIHFHDMIFPLFLFIIGVLLPFSL